MKTIIIDKIKDILWNEYQRIKNLDEIKGLDYDFYQKFHSWDSGDCSEVGLIIFLLWYIATVNNEMYHNDYKEIIKFCNDYKS